MPNNTTFVKEKTQDNFTTEKVDVIKNSLLGDYNEKGNYVISKQIVDELLLIKKVINNSFGNSIFCVANLEKYGDISFEVQFKKNTEKKLASAELFVLESVKKVNGYIYNTIKTPIAKLTDKLTDTFVSRTLALLNIVEKPVNKVGNDEEGGSQEFDIEAFNSTFIEARKNFIELLNKLTEKDINKAYEKYFNKRVSVLKESNSLYAQEILSDFNNDFNKIEPYFLKGKNGKVQYKWLSELLDASTEKVNGTNKEYLSDEIKYKENIKNFIDKFGSEIKEVQNNAVLKIINKDENLKEVATQINESVTTKETPVKVIEPNGSVIKTILNSKSSINSTEIKVDDNKSFQIKADKMPDDLLNFGNSPQENARGPASNALNRVDEVTQKTNITTQQENNESNSEKGSNVSGSIDIELIDEQYTLTDSYQVEEFFNNDSLDQGRTR